VDEDFGMLIRDGALLVRSGQDIVEALQNPEPAALEPKQTIPAQTSPEQVTEKILTLLGPNAIAEDILIRDIGLPAHSVSQHLLALELDGKIERHPGGMLALAG